MKKLISLILTIMLLAGNVPAFAEDAPAHVLVVYFSHAGENYNVGVIEEGNTAKMGKIIAEQMGADVRVIDITDSVNQHFDDIGHARDD